jgi:hypothetical protein
MTLSSSIATYLHGSNEPITVYKLCGHFTGEGKSTLKDFNQALRDLQVHVCDSCKGVISQTTNHFGWCPHGI